MKSSTTLPFRKQFGVLQAPVREQARKQFRLWLNDPFHPSLHFKQVGAYWSVRVTRDISVLGVRRNNEVVWFYIGGHDGYEGRI